MTLICRRLPRVSLLAGNKILFVLNAASGTPVGQIVAFMCNEIPGSERGAILAAVFCMVEANAQGIRNLHDLYVQVSPDIDRHLKVVAGPDLSGIRIRSEERRVGKECVRTCR